jgi:hypothetical protein
MPVEPDGPDGATCFLGFSTVEAAATGRFLRWTRRHCLP